MTVTRSAGGIVAVILMVALAGCSNIREATDSRAERGIVLEAQAATTLLQELAARSTEPITAQSLVDSQVVGALAITKEERDALAGGGERVAFGFDSNEIDTAVDVFVQSRTSTSEGITQASAALFGCTRITITQTGEASLTDIGCPEWLSETRIGEGEEVSIDQLTAALQEED